MRRIALLVALIALVLSGCALGGGGRSGQQATPTGELRWSIEGVGDLPSIDPARPGDSQAITVINMVFGGLVSLSSDLKIQPEGAESWTVSADGTIYTFIVRQGLVFADGAPVTADDFVFAINRAL